MVILYIALSLLSLIIGILSTCIYFKNKKYSELKERYSVLKLIKTPINKDKFTEIRDECINLRNVNGKLNNKVDKLKSYLGLVGDKEYSIIKRELTYGNGLGKDVPIFISAEFKTIQRGANKVKISLNIDSIKTTPNKSGDKELMEKCKEFVDDLYDIDDESITWVIPDKAMRREFDLDNIMDD